MLENTEVPSVVIAGHKECLWQNLQGKQVISTPITFDMFISDANCLLIVIL